MVNYDLIFHHILKVIKKVKSLTPSAVAEIAALLRFGSAPGPKAPSCVSACVVRWSVEVWSVVFLQ